MRALAVLALALPALSSCAAPTPSAPEQSAALGSATDCIDQQFIVSKQPAGNRAVVFEMTGGTTWRNDLPAACPGLEHYNASYTFLFDIKGGGRLCRNDEFRVFDPVEAKGVGTGAFPTCRLGGFTRIPNP